MNKAVTILTEMISFLLGKESHPSLLPGLEAHCKMLFRGLLIFPWLSLPRRKEFTVSRQKVDERVAPESRGKGKELGQLSFLCFKDQLGFLFAFLSVEGWGHCRCSVMYVHES